MGRSEREFTNLLLVEQPNGDFAQTMARQLFLDAYQLELWEGLSGSTDQTLAGIAAKALKEARYHFRHSSTWVIRLGDGTEESHRRADEAVAALWRFTGELFVGDDTDAAMAVGWNRGGPGDAPAGLGRQDRGSARRSPAGTADRRIAADRWPSGLPHRAPRQAGRRDAVAGQQHAGGRVVSTTIGTDDLTEIRSVIASVTDPEIPVLTIDDLGILRDVSIEEGRVVATITPTYSGAPAMDAIREGDCRVAPRAGGDGAHRSHPGVDDRLDERRGQAQARVRHRPLHRPSTRAPRCRAAGARTVSFFGSTACKALLVCSSCGEPFDLFKEL